MEAYNWGYNPKFDPDVADQEEPDVDCVKLLWPRELPGFKETLYQHHSQLLTLARRLTKTFALALHLDEDHFAEYIKHPAAAMRITHYPPQEVRIHRIHLLDPLTDENTGFTFGPTRHWRAY